MKKQYKILISVLLPAIFILAFTPSLNPLASGWTQQFMPDLGGRQITAITFLDSLNGYAVTNNLSPGDTGYILKTIDGGSNWNFVFTVYRGFTTIVFVNINTGYACGGSGGGTNFLLKTTNSGFNWFLVNTPSTFKWLDMSVLDTDNIWLVDGESLTGGVFRTTNGGVSWEHQINLGSDNPDHIYMYDGKLGFIAKSQRYLRRTTNGGANWTIDTTGSDSGFREMYFVDSLTGWKDSFFGIRKTTNGGLNWFLYQTAQGGIIIESFIGSFSNVNRDTIWGSGGYVLYPNNQTRALLHRTTNGGINWLFQIPDTSLIGAGGKVKFISKLVGWVYSSTGSGIHTTTGGDTTFYTSSNQIKIDLPKEFKLFQNYPNPFNPTTVIKFQIKILADIKLKVYDITGKSLEVLSEKKYKPGSYEVIFNGSALSSGVYLYSLSANDKFVETKKMILLK